MFFVLKKSSQQTYQFVKVNGILTPLTVLVWKGAVCLIDENSREVSVGFQTRGGVSVI